jgi:hypothetical protein
MATALKLRQFMAKFDSCIQQTPGEVRCMADEDGDTRDLFIKNRGPLSCLFYISIGNSRVFIRPAQVAILSARLVCSSQRPFRLGRERHTLKIPLS